ncbi:putative peroxygenase 5 [Panicum miliaceum]|uniref:Peroxygenase 5 n=1 Tax=Panicum miliaceum TaxID=4540 RepID=A0A3L6RXN9_PANMI|nr:putative peroxygenase 5 [Panicum miliaceum]
MQAPAMSPTERRRGRAWAERRRPSRRHESRGREDPSWLVGKFFAARVSPSDAAKERPPSSTADAYEQGELTPLQRHVAFFDRDKGGVIYSSETYEGFRAIGCGVPLSAVAAVYINGRLGPKTIPENEKIPPFKLPPIYVKNIHKGKHGSDSGVYDANGRFVPEKFDEIFKKHAHTRPDALTGKELQELLRNLKTSMDGKLGGFTEWKVLYYMCKDKDGFLHKDTARAVYDGSLFERLENERKSKESTS